MVTRERNFHGLPPESDIETPNRAVLEQSVAEALAVDGAISPSDIVVVEADGTVYLRGAVSSEFEAERAVDVAASILGVRSVVNELTIVTGNG